MDWAKEDVDYWINPDCPRDYLEKSLFNLIEDIEGVSVSEDYIQELSDDTLRKKISRYEYVSDK